MALVSLHDVPAPAKLNLFLHVTGRRADGYHLLDSLMVLLDWHDTLHFVRRDDGRLTRRDLLEPLPADDLCLRAARALQAASATRFGADIAIEKRLPSGAGLGGGSSDAASTLLALDRLWELGWGLDRLLPLAESLGADVPFFLAGANARAGGIGERLRPVELPAGWYAVVKPPGSLETRAVFQRPEVAELVAAKAAAARIAGFSESNPPPNPSVGRRPGNEPELLPGFGRNDLQAAAAGLCPEVDQAATALSAVFGNSRMTGSGSAVFARAGLGLAPEAQMPGEWPAGWTARMCRSLVRHPLAGWASGRKTPQGSRQVG